VALPADVEPSNEQEFRNQMKEIAAHVSPLDMLLICSSLFLFLQFWSNGQSKLLLGDILTCL
jgi:hypothetical protein